jgi:hypothetical protein
VTDTSTAIARMRDWGEAREWRGWDPYDALNSPLAPYVTLGTGVGRRLLTQAVKHAPVNVRPVLGIKPAWNPKAVALVASAYSRLWAAHRDEAARTHAVSWLEWLLGNASAEVGLGWGYHFDVETRFFGYARGTPNAIATSFAAHALLDGHELLDDCDERWGAAAGEVCRFLLETLFEDDGERVYFRYLPAERELVHNANVLACSVLARTAEQLGRSDLEQTARRALACTLRAQAPSGAWPYSESQGWIDNFHTGYVLEGLAVCAAVDDALRLPLERGLDYWGRELFLDDGTPKYYADRVFPVDSHNYAQAIETWLAVVPWRPHSLALAERCAAALIERMQTRAGYIAFQRRRLWKNSVPFVRWSTAPAFRALARLELARAGLSAS